MKPFPLFITVLYLCANLNAQIYEPIGYKSIHYLDNLPLQIIPELFYREYYNSLCPSDYKGTVKRNHTEKSNVVNLRSKKAKTGYLYVNGCIQDYIQQSEGELDQDSLLYVVNDEPVTTKKDVKRLVRLRKRRVLSIRIEHDSKSGLIMVYIQTARQPVTKLRQTFQPSGSFGAYTYSTVPVTHRFVNPRSLLNHLQKSNIPVQYVKK